MDRVVRPTMALLLWGAALYGALSIAKIPGDFGHALCGPWGCAPPAQALAACHLAWLIVLVPLSLLVRRCLPGNSQWLLAGALLLAGAVALSLLVYRELTVWWQEVDPYTARYLPHRLLFAVLVNVDVPIVPLLISALLCAVWRKT
ncbi:MAG: hypothetical protein KatS3mg110_3526 [Pirellulaceae bacterium]|nr:MAG: hypothetical protein KatS3mg110_3526 [Pirellulaceae bacterium]